MRLIGSVLYFRLQNTKTALAAFSVTGDAASPAFLIFIHSLTLYRYSHSFLPFAYFRFWAFTLEFETSTATRSSAAFADNSENLLFAYQFFVSSKVTEVRLVIVSFVIPVIFVPKVMVLQLEPLILYKFTLISL